MKRKTKQSYLIICNFLKSKAAIVDPSLTILDFESASKNAFKLFFSQVKINGCLFLFFSNYLAKFLA